MQASTVAMCGPDDGLDDAEGVAEPELEVLFDDPPQAARAAADRTTAKYLSAASLAMAAVVSQGSGPMSNRIGHPSADRITRRAEVAQLGRALD
jgi:hypothetical protein